MGIGSTSAVFSVVDSIVLKPLPYPEPERLVALYNSYPNAGEPRSQNAVTDYYDRRAGVAGWFSHSITEEVVRLAKCPVMVVKPQEEKGKPARAESRESSDGKGTPQD